MQLTRGDAPMTSQANQLLLSPEPIEQSSFQREGLFSLFRRICERNQLTVNDVVAELLVPLAGPGDVRVRKLLKPLHLLNRGGGLSERFILRMQEISVAQNWWLATAKELGVCGMAELPLVRYRRWCPQCYDDDCALRHGPYDRLLWSIEAVEACPRHNVQLQSVCSECGASQMPVLMGLDLSGFCPYCRSFLGLRPSRLDPADDYSSYLLWVARSFADLLDSPLPADHDVTVPIQTLIRMLSDRHFNGAYAHLAAAIGRNKSVVGTWLAGSSAPGWLAICTVSFVFHLPLRDLLLGDSTAVEFSVLRPLPLGVREGWSSPRKRPERRDLDQFRTFMSQVESGQHLLILTMVAVAKRLNIDSSDLRRRLPDECAQLSAVLKERRRTAGEWKRSARERSLNDAVQQVGEDLARSNASGTRRGIELRLANLGFHIRYQESIHICARVRVARLAADLQKSGNSLPPDDSGNS